MHDIRNVALEIKWREISDFASSNKSKGSKMRTKQAVVKTYIPMDLLLHFSWMQSTVWEFLTTKLSNHFLYSHEKCNDLLVHGYDSWSDTLKTLNIESLFEREEILCPPFAKKSLKIFFEKKTYNLMKTRIIYVCIDHWFIELFVKN